MEESVKYQMYFFLCLTHNTQWQAVYELPVLAQARIMRKDNGQGPGRYFIL